jgi:uncharacterized protein (TIGR00255 family)
MTGFGEAHSRQPHLSVAVEVRSTNNRHYKLHARLDEGCAALEPQIDQLVRQRIRRGTVQVTVRVARCARPEDFRVNTDVLISYHRQLDAVRAELGMTGPPPLEAMLQLPGVVVETGGELNAERDWPVIEETLHAALDQLGHMREAEGRAMRLDLESNCRIIAEQLSTIEQQAVRVGDVYRERLYERLKKILDQHGVRLETVDLLREISIFAERSDISEEIIRLRSHLEQFAASLDLPESSGRKLEFVNQELFREANTIGAKANDVDISRAVIEIKSCIERIREMIQNVE